MWEGTYQIWQDREFAEIYAAKMGKLLRRVDEMLVYISKKPLIGTTTVYLYCPPVGNDVLDMLRDYAKGIGAAKVVIYSADKPVNLQVGHTTEHNTTIIDLTMDEEWLWKIVGSKTRNMIRKGEKNGIEVDLACGGDAFHDWWNVYANTAGHKGFAIQDMKLVQALYENAHLARLYVAKHKGTIIGGCFFLLGKYPMYWLGSFDAQHRNLAAGHITMWKSILSLRNLGYRLLDMGGVSTDGVDGPTRFKKSFNGELRVAYMTSLPINIIKNAIVNAVQRLA